MIKKRVMSFIILIFFSFITSGCWNYEEINELTVVAGIAIDKSDTGDTYELTAEVINVPSGMGTKPSPRYISKSGKTIFDASRNMLDVTGQKLYWAHAKVIIVSPEVAREGIRKVVDWYERDAETRTEIQLLISKTERASDIFNKATDKSKIISLQLNDSLTNAVFLSKTPSIELWEFINSIEQAGVSPYTGWVELSESAGSKVPDITGTAVFKQDMLVGSLDDDETMSFMFVTDQIKGGVLVEDIRDKSEESKISLEIFKNKTRVTPVTGRNHDISFSINTETLVAIDEVEGGFDIKKEENIKALEELAGRDLKARIEGVIQKLQKDYKSDIIGFGTMLYRDNPGEWNLVQKNWDSIYQNLKVNVSCVVRIRNTAMMNDSITVNK